jgi:hypothetical protein
MSLNRMVPGAGADSLDRSISAPNLRTPVHAPYQQGGSLPFFVLRSLICVFLPLIVAQATIFQVQMLLLHGRVPINTVAVKAVVIILFMAGLLLRSRISNAQIMTVTLIFVSYLILDGLRFHFGLNVDGLDVIQGVNSYYSYVFIAVLALLVPYRISERRVIQIFVVMFIICAIIGLAQFIANSPILPTRSSDGSFGEFGFEDFGTFRPFSLFLGPVTFSLIGVAAAALGFTFWRKHRRMAGGSLFLSGLLVVVICKSRMNYPALMGALGTVLFLTRGPRRKWHRLLPLIWLGLGLGVAAFAFALSTGGGVTNTVTDTSTLTSRLQIWASYIGEFSISDPMGSLFGLGLVENHNVATNATAAPIDNFFLATALHIGAVGLFLCIMLAWSLWREILSAAQETGSPLAIAVAATFSTMLCLGMFQATIEPVSTYFILYAVSQVAMFRRASPQLYADVRNKPLIASARV